MTVQGWLQILVFFAVLTALTPLVGGYMARVFTGERVFLTPVMGPLDRLFHNTVSLQPAKRAAQNLTVARRFRVAGARK